MKPFVVVVLKMWWVKARRVSMLKPWRTTGLSWLWLGLLVLVADQLTKYWALIALIPYDPMSIMPMLNITLAFNTGAAFSFLGDAGGWQRWLFLALAMGVSLALLVWLYRTPSHHFTLNIGLVMVLSGAIGNAIDRASMGMVVDFIDIIFLIRLPQVWVINIYSHSAFCHWRYCFIMDEGFAIQYFSRCWVYRSFWSCCVKWDSANQRV
jgi:signal peptidase II